jgi:hypothetical protein
MNDHYEKVFDAITYVEHNKKDKTIIEKMHGDGGHGHEVVQFSTPVRAVGTYTRIFICSLLSGFCLYALIITVSFYSITTVDGGL